MTATRSRADTAYQALRQSIIEQALPPGTRLPEDVIGKEFGMSRTLARATLARFQFEGLVEAGRKRTATVARPSLEEAKEDFEVRRALEREVIRLVVARWKAEFGAVLEGHVREEERRRRARTMPACRSASPASSTSSSRRCPATGCCERYLSRGGVALLADPRALRPAAFARMRRRRASRDHRGVAPRRCQGRIRADGQSRRLGRGARAARRAGARSRRGALALCGGHREDQGHDTALPRKRTAAR